MYQQEWVSSFHCDVMDGEESDSMTNNNTKYTRSRVRKKGGRKDWN